MNLDLDLLDLQEAGKATSEHEEVQGIFLAVNATATRSGSKKADVLFIDAINRGVLRKLLKMLVATGDPFRILHRCYFFVGFLSELLQGFFQQPREASSLLGDLLECFQAILAVSAHIHEVGAGIHEDAAKQVEELIVGVASCLAQLLQSASLAPQSWELLVAALAGVPEAGQQLVVAGERFGGRVMRTTAASAIKMMKELYSAFETEAFLKSYEALRRAARPGETAHAEMVLGVQKTVIPTYGFSADSAGVADMREELLLLHMEQRDEEIGALRQALDNLLGLGEKCIGVDDEKRRIEEEFAASYGRTGKLPLAREEWVLGEAADGGGSEPVDGICAVTQCSLDRLGHLEELLAFWPGYVSASVYVDAAPGSEAARNAFEVVVALRERAARRGRSPQRWSLATMFRLEDSEVKCPAYDQLYPVNSLRNAALERARAGLVLLVDVDFVPSKGLYSVLCGDDGGRRLRRTLSGGADAGKGPVALVVPAFEEIGGKPGPLPRDGVTLRAACQDGSCEGFHIGSFPKGHQATDFPRWLAGGVGSGRLLEKKVHGVDAYPIVYEEQFEPYVVLDRSLSPPYDERFRGYGWNKASHLFELNARGFDFAVLGHPDAFLISRQHEPSESRKRYMGHEKGGEQHRARIAQHWGNFQSELRRKLRGFG